MATGAGSSTTNELSDLPDIPLRRRGRPAGDGTSAVASPHELQERRMQANRAAASRSHFRCKSFLISWQFTLIGDSMRGVQVVQVDLKEDS